jgi:DNA polymerase III delta' subunit
MSTPGSSAARDELRRARASGRVHGAYLIEGAPGSGAHELAMWFARLLLCTSNEPDPCERCPGCRKTRLDPESGRPLHPDWALIAPDGNTTKVEQVRLLLRHLSLVANEGGRRVALLQDAETLNVNAANALLKTLEEPPSGATLILVARSSEAMPPTVRSRTVRLRIASPSAETIAETLERGGLAADDARLAAELGGGSDTAAQAWADEHLEGARELRELLRGAESAADGEILDAAEQFRGGGETLRLRTQLFFDVYEAHARLAIRDAIERGDSGAAERWLTRAERGIAARREAARRNLNPQLLVEGLLFELRAAR